MVLEIPDFVLCILMRNDEEEKNETEAALKRTIYRFRLRQTVLLSHAEYAIRFSQKRISYEAIIVLSSIKYK